MNNKRVFILFFIIIVVASLLRFWQLGQVPSSPDWDEASLGYNAYSIMQTGRDEYGKFMPLIMRSFDDYKPALYVYFVIPFIKLLGLNVVSVRLPSVIFGILTVIATYFLVIELFKNRGVLRLRSGQAHTQKIALLTSFLLAISPWHIQFSRIAFESNVGLALNVFGILFFLKGLKKPIWFLLSSFVFGMSFHIYQSEKVFLPLLFLVLLLIYRKEIVKIPKKYIISAGLLLLIILLPLFSFMLTNKEALARARGVSVFSDQTPFLKDNVIRVARDKENNDFLGIVLDNRRILYAKSIVAGYMSHFDLNWLFITGDISRHHAPGMGLLYLFELPFLLIGIYVFIFNSNIFGLDKQSKLLIILWFLITPIPASITSGVPHAVRTLNFLPTFQIFTAFGILFAFRKISNLGYLRYLIFFSLSLFFIFNFSYYLNQYFVQQNYFNSQDWQYGYEDTVSFVDSQQYKYSKIVVSNKPYLDQSYIFFLFYLKYPPADYQKESLFASGGFRENHKFGKFEFRPIDWNKEEKSENILYVGKPDDFPQNVKVIKEVNFLNGQPAIKIVED
ncbi:MAG: glycosyltransferase family 39 protein [Candidatus Levybacteria bacterium]|nr:glycosyltransferase family 39 protein [Candidatus Levybacteria bacterium]